jgi:hypothetical protein
MRDLEMSVITSCGVAIRYVFFFLIYGIYWHTTIGEGKERKATRRELERMERSPSRKKKEKKKALLWLSF